MERALKIAEAKDRSGTPALRLLLFAESPQRAEIRDVLARMKDFRLDLQEAELDQQVAAHDGMDAVMVVMDKPHEFPAAAREVRTSDGRRPMRVALLRDRASSAIRDALAAGADEVLFLPLDEGNVARALLKLAGPPKSKSVTAKGRVYSVSSVTTGVGVTTVAANCALALAYWGKKKVAVVDLDYESGDLATALNLEPEYTISDLKEPVGQLNSPQVEAVLNKHSSGVYLLAAPKRLEESEQIAAAQVTAVLELMQQMVDCVVVDTGRHVDETAVAVWERSDELLYVIDQSVRAMRGAWRFLDLFLRLKLTDTAPKFVLNRFTPRHPLREHHVTNTLGRPIFARIPSQDKVMELALARGEDLWKVAARSSLTASFERLARDLASPQAGQRKRSLWAGLFSRNGNSVEH